MRRRRCAAKRKAPPQTKGNSTETSPASKRRAILHQDKHKHKGHAKGKAKGKAKGQGRTVKAKAAQVEAVAVAVAVAVAGGDEAETSEDSGTDGYFTAEDGYPTTGSDTEELQDEEDEEAEAGEEDEIDGATAEEYLAPKSTTIAPSTEQEKPPSKAVTNVAEAETVRRSGRRRVSTWKLSSESPFETYMPTKRTMKPTTTTTTTTTTTIKATTPTATVTATATKSSSALRGKKKSKRMIRITADIRQALEDHYIENPRAKIDREGLGKALNRDLDDKLWNCIRVYVMRKIRPVARVQLGDNKNQVLALMVCFAPKKSPDYLPLNAANLTQFLEEYRSLFRAFHPTEHMFEALRICWKTHEDKAEALAAEARAKGYTPMEVSRPDRMGSYSGFEYSWLQVDAIVRHFGTRKAGKLVPRTKPNIEAFLAAYPELFDKLDNTPGSRGVIRYLWEKYEGSHLVHKNLSVSI